MVITYCSAIIGFLCIQAPIGGTTTVQIEDQGMYINNVIQAKSWKASWGQSTEWPAPNADLKQMEKVCVEDDCRAYFRLCKTPLDCRFAVADLASGAAQLFRIEAKDEAAMTEALSHVGVVVKREPMRVIPAAAMDKEGKADDLPLLPAKRP